MVVVVVVGVVIAGGAGEGGGESITLQDEPHKVTIVVTG